MQTNVHYLAVLANADPSLEVLPLRHGFRFQCLSYEKLICILAALHKLPPAEIASRLLDRYVHEPTNSPTKFSDLSSVVIHASLVAELHFNTEGLVTNLLSSEVITFQSRVVQDYLDSLLRKLRLYKDGNLCKIADYYFIETPEGLRTIMARSSSGDEVEGLYTVATEEIPLINSFVQQCRLPSDESSLGIVFSSFEQSYKTPRVSLGFILLINALESLVGYSFGSPPSLPKTKLNGADYSDFKQQARIFLSKWHFDEGEVDRLVLQLLSTHSQPIAVHFHSYLKSIGITEFLLEEVQMWWRLRGRLAHGSPVDHVQLRDTLKRLRNAVREALKRELQGTTDAQSE